MTKELKQACLRSPNQPAVELKTKTQLVHCYLPCATLSTVSQDREAWCVAVHGARAPQNLVT